MFESCDGRRGSSTQLPPEADLPPDTSRSPKGSRSPEETGLPPDAGPSPEEVLSQGYLMVESIAGISAEIARLDAERLKLIALLHDSEFMRPLTAPPSAQAEARRLHRPLRDLDRQDTTRAEVAHRLRLRPYEARRLVEAALALTTRFPKTLHALSQGQLDLTRAQIIADAGTPLADHHHTTARKDGFSPADAETAAATIADALETHVLKRAATQTPDQLRDCLTRAIHRLDPTFAAATAKDNLAARQVTYRGNRDQNTADLYAHLGAAEGLGIYNVLDAYTRTARHTGSPRRLNELRADALVHLILNGHLPDATTPITPITPQDLTADATTLVPDIDPHTGDIPHPDHPERTDCPDHPDHPDHRDPERTDLSGRPDQPDWTDHPARTDCPDHPGPTERTDSAGASPVPDVSSPGETNSSDTATTHETSYRTGKPTPGGGPTPSREPEIATTQPWGERAKAENLIPTSKPIPTGKSTSGQSTLTGQPTLTDGTPSGAAAHVPGPAPGSRSALRAHVQVTVGLNTLLGLNDEPGELDGHGPITAETVRDLAFASGSTWRRLVTDPVTGYLLDYGRSTYRPPTALADHVRARDVTCRTPNCTRPASKCDLDHVISWPAGATSERNLAAECDIDHRLKHEGRWSHHVSTNPDHPPGTIIMISPTGHTYLSHPHDYNDPWPEKPAKPPTRRADSSTARPAPPDDPGPPPF